MFKEPEPYAECSATQAPSPLSIDDHDDSIAKSAQEFTLALSNLKTVKWKKDVLRL